MALLVCPLLITANLTLAAEEQLDRAKGGPLARLLVRRMAFTYRRGRQKPMFVWQKVT